MTAHEDGLFPELLAFECLRPEQLVDYILEQGAKVSAIEKAMDLAATALEGYGTSIDAELDRRQKEIKNENQ